MVVDYLPRSSFSLIDVGDAMLDGDLLSCKLELPMLDACFVGPIPRNPDELIFQFNLPVCGQLSHFFK